MLPASGNGISQAPPWPCASGTDGNRNNLDRFYFSGEASTSPRIPVIPPVKRPGAWGGRIPGEKGDMARPIRFSSEARGRAVRKFEPRRNAGRSARHPPAVVGRHRSPVARVGAPNAVRTHRAGAKFTEWNSWGSERAAWRLVGYDGIGPRRTCPPGDFEREPPPSVFREEVGEEQESGGEQQRFDHDVFSSRGPAASNGGPCRGTTRRRRSEFLRLIWGYSPAPRHCKG